MLAALRRQAFLEILDASDTSSVSFRDEGDNAETTHVEGGDVADRLVKALSALEPYVEDPTQFNDLCFLCTLGSVSEHPEYTEWTASRGRLIAYDTCVDELREVYGSIPGRGEHERTLETAMRHAVAHLTQTSSLAGRRLPRSAGLLKRLGMAAGSNPHGGDEVHRFFSATRELEKRKKAKEAKENASPNVSSDPSLIARTRTNDKASRGLGGTLPTFGPSMRASVGVSSFPAIERLERMKKRPGLLGRSWNPSSEQFVQSKRGGVDSIKEEEEERIETAALDARSNDGDVDVESDDRSVAWDVTPEEEAREAEFVADGEAFVEETDRLELEGGDDSYHGVDDDSFLDDDRIGAYADVDPTAPPVFYQPVHEPACVDKSAGIRCLAWNPRGDSVCGVNCNTNVGGSNPGGGAGVFACATSGRTVHVCTGGGKTLLRIQDVHGDSDCSIYTVAWGGDVPGGTHSLIATGGNDGSVGVTRLKWSDDYADSLRLVAVNGKARVNRRAHPGGAVRGVAFLNPTSVISAGGGDYSPRVWDLGAAGASMPDECTRVLRPHGAEIVGVCADWGSFAGAGSTENFASTASADGEIRIWDLREWGTPPTLRLNARGAAGGDHNTTVSAMSVRGERVAVGYSDGGVAVLDLRYASTVSSDDTRTRADFDSDSGAAAVWSDKFHDGECRSVDLDPSGKLLLTAGFDGVCCVVNAADGVNANVANAADENYGPARGIVVLGGFTAGGVYCGHDDKVVSARWRPGTSDGAVGFASCGVDRTVRYWRAKSV